MADRAGIVVGGALTVVDTVDHLRERATRMVELDFEHPPPAALGAVPGVRSVEVRGRTAVCHVSGRLTDLLEVAVLNGVVDVHTHDPDLEDAFLDVVRTGRTRVQ